MEYRLKIGEDLISFQAERKGDHSITLSRDGCLLDVEYTVISEHHLHLLVNGSPVNAYLAPDGNGKTVIIRGIPYSIGDADILDTRGQGEEEDHRPSRRTITPPMPAVVVRILVSAGRQGETGRQGDRRLVDEDGNDADRPREREGESGECRRGRQGDARPDTDRYRQGRWQSQRKKNRNPADSRQNHIA